MSEDRLSSPSPGPSAAAERGPAVLARRIRGRVLAVPGVSGLSAGPFGATATPAPGGRIEGVAVRGGGVEVGVVVSLGRPIPDTATGVHEAVRAAVRGGGGRVHVSVEDAVEDGNVREGGGEAG
ncbi:hypothetical protein [Streptomonospora wellingtoniae]|uniref:Asp23/Gls24 family envelope stress response protein n=1 Tax=Streptomonospora wellingtoniae TaxID=3075544 RepID=A0ABU2KQL5_9ACTN|nr:hypothetical protein [Streptomonospora sp. DSM 45055]MDT0301576.1 hypothetical protein [Streptomonospora sp. DSM 45055]